MERSIDPEAMNWPVGSKRAAKISPECPVNSMTGDWSTPARGTCHACQPSQSLAIAHSTGLRMKAYRLYEGAIFPSAIRYGYRRVAVEVRIRLCSFDQLRGAE